VDDDQRDAVAQQLLAAPGSPLQLGLGKPLEPPLPVGRENVRDRHILPRDRLAVGEPGGGALAVGAVDAEAQPTEIDDLPAGVLLAVGPEGLVEDREALLAVDEVADDLVVAAVGGRTCSEGRSRSRFSRPVSQMRSEPIGIPR
jgi:hypothetical protein